MKFLFYLGLILFFASCDQSKEDLKQVVEKPESRVVKKHVSILKVDIQFQSKIEDWKEYEAINNFIQQFTTISPNEALNNSRELNGLTKSLRDSIKPVFLEGPAFSARINLLFNETLRLYDLSSIPAIKPQQVNEQVEKVLNSFSSVNSKINTIILQSNLESEVVDVNFKRIQNTILVNKEEEEPKIILSKKKKPKLTKSTKKASFPSREELMKKGTLKRTKKSKDNGKKTGN
ncbi:MAG: hypothetical protein JKY02_06040 [Flavobacteriaceae bacterium]|nr:hypothetical protein [Flavobacteriaceae bacterium]